MTGVTLLPRQPLFCHLVVNRQPALASHLLPSISQGAPAWCRPDFVRLSMGHIRVFAILPDLAPVLLHEILPELLPVLETKNSCNSWSASVVTPTSWRFGSETCCFLSFCMHRGHSTNTTKELTDSRRNDSNAQTDPSGMFSAANDEPLRSPRQRPTTSIVKHPRKTDTTNLAARSSPQ